MSETTIVQLIITVGGIIAAWLAMRAQIRKDDREAERGLSIVRGEAERAVYIRLKEELEGASARANGLQSALDSLRNEHYRLRSETIEERLKFQNRLDELSDRVTELEHENLQLKEENALLRKKLEGDG